MNKEELVLALRTEAWEIRELIKKMQKRSDKLSGLADDIESQGKTQPKNDVAPTKFRKIVDAIYGEKPARKPRG